MRYIRVGYKSLISSVKKNDSIAITGEIYPFFQNFLGHYRPGRIIGKAKVDNIHLLFWYVRDEAILSGAGHINDFAVLAVFVGLAGPASHYIGIHIYRVHRVGYGSNIIQTQYFLDI